MSAGKRLREVLAARGCAMAVGAHDPVIARLVEGSGAPVVYVSGSATSAVVGGMADVGLLSFSEMLDHAGHVVAATELPTLCDVDTGFGETTNVRRTIEAYEAIGAAGVHIEDQTFPKRCGQTAGSSLVPTAHMQRKLAAAKEAQRDGAFVVIARTDARASEGVEGVLARARAYLDAGADAIFPEALLSLDEFRTVRREVSAPLVIDVPEWGRSPTLTLDELEAVEWDLAIYAVSALRVALYAAREFVGGLRGARSQRPWLDRMVTRDELDGLLGLGALRAEEDRLERAFPESS